MSKHLEYKLTTSSIFNYFNIKKDSNIANSGQYHATVIIMQKKPKLYIPGPTHVQDEVLSSLTALFLAVILDAS